TAQAGRARRARRLGGLARVGRRVVPRARLVRGGSDQRPGTERSPRRARVGPRLRRRLAREGRDAGRRVAQGGGDGRGEADSRAVALKESSGVRTTGPDSSDELAPRRVLL